MAARNDTLARALALLNSGQAAQAEAMLRRSLSQGGAGAEHLLGLALAQQRKGEQAEFFLRAAVRDDPGRAGVSLGARQLSGDEPAARRGGRRVSSRAGV
jgi:Tfp pilus assembly protein PilF